MIRGWAKKVRSYCNASQHGFKKFLKWIEGQTTPIPSDFAAASAVSNEDGDPAVGLTAEQHALRDEELGNLLPTFRPPTSSSTTRVEAYGPFIHRERDHRPGS